MAHGSHDHVARQHMTNKEKYARQRDRTRVNKIKHIKKALLVATGTHVQFLTERLNFWTTVR